MRSNRFLIALNLILFISLFILISCEQDNDVVFFDFKKCELVLNKNCNISRAYHYSNRILFLELEVNDNGNDRINICQLNFKNEDGIDKKISQADEDYKVKLFIKKDEIIPYQFILSSNRNGIQKIKPIKGSIQKTV
jgi:hypothetical protein